MTTGWKGESKRHSIAKKYGKASSKKVVISKLVSPATQEAKYIISVSEKKSKAVVVVLPGQSLVREKILNALAIDTRYFDWKEADDARNWVEEREAKGLVVIDSAVPGTQDGWSLYAIDPKEISLKGKYVFKVESSELENFVQEDC